MGLIKQDFFSVSYPKNSGHDVNTKESANMVLLGCHDIPSPSHELSRLNT